MIRSLPDVNVLLALLWPKHKSHEAAQEWFAATGHRSWATNPMVQLGTLRLLTNPAVTQSAIDSRSASEVLAEAMRHPGHAFWPLENTYPSGLENLIDQIQGYRQWTDAALLSHAIARKGVLVTFDSGIAKLAGREFGRHVVLLRA